MKVLLVLENSRLAMRVLVCLRPLDVRVHAVGRTRQTAVRFSRHLEHYAVFDPPGPDAESGAFAAWAEAYIRDHGIEMVIPIDVGSAKLVHGLRLNGARLFPVSAPPLLDTLNDKWSFLGLLDRLGIRHPRSELIADAAEAASERIAGFCYPALVKPLAESGTLGVAVIDSHAGLLAYIAEDRPLNRPPLLLQEHVPGTDVALNILARDGRILAWTMHGFRPNLIDRSAYVLEFIDDGRVIDFGRRIVAETGYTGVANFDMRIDARDGGPTVFECNPRFFANLPASMAHGVNFLALGMAEAGDAPDCGRSPTYRLGSYRPPSNFLRTLFLRPWQLRHVSAVNRRAFFQEMSDPLPMIYAMLPDLKKPRR